MHLKSLTLRGFKSFASSTTLRLEPGITCVVGPNGSGKSNVVDAIAWVLGEQGPKSLRGGAMSDVIFAGTPGRPALGRAEVLLSIDNSDHTLPIDYAEVVVSRLLFRSGESEYAINGTPCRLLDVQELLSDAGLGRELHVIVGQGEIDATLRAKPEDRRALIEEAAGVLKHRKRKEKALRKLEAMQANLTRLEDLTTELRRQLKPLGRQAEVAKRAAVIQAELRDMRLRLLADDLAGLRTTYEAELRDEAELRARRTAVESQLATVTAREAELEVALAADMPLLSRGQETYFRLTSLRERFRGTVELAAERERNLAADPDVDTTRGRSAEDLDAEAASVRREEAAIRTAVVGDHDQLAAAETAREALEQRLHAEETALLVAARAQADRREGVARLAGDVGALRTRAAAADEEMARLGVARDDALGRASKAQAEFLVVQQQVVDLDAGELGLDDHYESAAAKLAQANARVAELVSEEQEAERERSFWTARRDALDLSLLRRDGAGHLLGLDDPPAALLGRVASLLDVEDGFEAAVAAALGSLADAVAVATPDDAAAAMQRLKTDEAGRAALLVGEPTTFPGDITSPPPRSGDPSPAAAVTPPGDIAVITLPDGARWALDVVTAPEPLRGAVARALANAVVVADLDAARALLGMHPDLVAVTTAGDLLSAWRADGGSAHAPSLLEMQAAADEAAERLTAASARADRLRFALAAARDDQSRSTEVVDRALESLHESDAHMSAVAEQLAVLGSQQRAATDEADRLTRAQHDAEVARDRDLAGLAALEAQLAEVAGAPFDVEPGTDVRDRVAAELSAARAAEVDVRLRVVAAEERARALASRAESLEKAASGERTARELRAAQRVRRAQDALVAGAVVRAATTALQRLEASLVTAAAERDAIDAARTVHETELVDVRTRRRELSGEHESLTDVAHRDDVARTEQRLRIEALESRCAEDFGIDPALLGDDYGPDVPVPPAGDAPEGTKAKPYDRMAVERRAGAADRALALLGRVNPLALEEFTALEERLAFLTGQVEDLKSSKRDLLTVIREVDSRIEEVFRSAFDDTAREFERTFAALFPGGSGRLYLTEPDDVLASGIEVEARPPGKKVKQLSLLSGGERSLTALALLIAIFKARPSPFYVLDEVEAALDDRNLERLLDLVEEFRGTSQLVIVTHQKRTMEIADALYGVTMKGDGISAVVSQRLREREDAPV